MIPKRTWLPIVVLIFANGFVHAQSFERSMDEVSAMIARERPLPTPSLPPMDIPDVAPRYYPELRFTIIALSSNSFTDLFAAKPTALSIVSVWQTNVGDPSLDDTKYDALKTALGNVVSVLNSTPAYQNLTFARMVDRRLQNELANDQMTELDSALDGLVSAHFQFPLFRKPTGNVTYKDIMKLLYTLCEKHLHRTEDTNNGDADKGGLGNLTWEELFYTPALRTYYSEKKINRTMKAESGAAKMQGQILPDPKPSNKDLGHENTVEVTDQCCSNDSQNGDYRRCIDKTGYSCTTCGTHCCIAGVQWCP